MASRVVGDSSSIEIIAIASPDDLTTDMGVPIGNLRYEPESFPERNAAVCGIECHDTNSSECPFEQSLGNRPTDPGPPER